MQKTKYFTCVCHSVLSFYFTRCEIKFNKLFDYEYQQLQKKYKILQLIITEALIITILWEFTENAQKNRILF